MKNRLRHKWTFYTSSGTGAQSAAPNGKVQDIKQTCWHKLLQQNTEKKLHHRQHPLVFSFKDHRQSRLPGSNSGKSFVRTGEKCPQSQTRCALTVYQGMWVTSNTLEWTCHVMRCNVTVVHRRTKVGAAPEQSWFLLFRVEKGAAAATFTAAGYTLQLSHKLVTASCDRHARCDA